jgi:hypothetical protein
MEIWDRASKLVVPSTVTGTRSYAAHEVRETTNTESLDYTNALDI